MPESLSGLVERVTFHQEDTGFVVLKVQVTREGNRIIGGEGERPAETVVRWFPSRYDSRRAHLAVYTAQRVAAVAVDASPFLAAGARYRLYAWQQLAAAPLTEGMLKGPMLTVPVTGGFGAFVVFRD